MGRSASHIAVECALQTQPNICIISEEVESKDYTLDNLAEEIARVVAARAEKGLNFGTILIPEGLIEFIPSIKRLISELNDLLALHKEAFEGLDADAKIALVRESLSPENEATFETLPEAVARQLALERDPHGNVQVSLIETEQLLAELTEKKLAQWKEEGRYKGSFKTQHHFFGYEGRCAAPSNFDADYCYSLGYTASMLINSGKTGYMASVKNTVAHADEWIAGGVPITMMMNIEKRNGQLKPVIRKALVDLNGAPFKELLSHREEWAFNTCFVYPGPIQYFGPSEVCDRPTLTLQLEHPTK
jgi:pyrophosphate--fructose-6-phosphate 1-phosphotransferase